MLQLERRIAIDAVIRASKICRQVYSQLVNEDTVIKKDRSPVTVADYSAQAVVNTLLTEYFPNDPIVGEEDSKDLKSSSGAELLKKVTELANTVLDKKITSEQTITSIDRGNFIGGSKGRFWTLDPIDGTKGFLRGGQYAICLALIIDGKVELGVMGCPNLLINPFDKNSSKGAIFIAQRGEGAYQRDLDTPNNIIEAKEISLDMNKLDAIESARFCESVEAGHSSHDKHAIIAKELNITTPPVRMDSQCKYSSIARGDGDIYLRLPVSLEYEEKIWDHASGKLLVEEAGGKVSDAYGQELDFSQGRTLKNNKGVVACHAEFHEQVIKAVSKALGN
ncbi:3',5'-bisphosphate nucleotidase [Neoconidiobolus thromboides FSU 785]|nr:3',5'-bisphosphate nucleotidase [Neoconidiobolus thromboides FSU 785]